MSVARSSRRYFDPRFEATIITVAPGEHEITAAKDEIVATVLGSCISVCMRDPQAGVGGLNHFLLPKNTGSSDTSAGERYGDTAMEVLINEMIRLGADRRRMVAKVFGGGRVLQGFGNLNEPAPPCDGGLRRAGPSRARRSGPLVRTAGR